MKLPALALLLAICVGMPRAALGRPEDQPVGATAEKFKLFEKAIAHCIVEARTSYPQAKLRFLKGLPPGNHFSVTTRLVDPDGKIEQVFISVIGINPSTNVVTGRIANQIQFVRTFRTGQTISFPESRVLDWTIVSPDGAEEGNYIGKFIDAYRMNHGDFP